MVDWRSLALDIERSVWVNALLEELNGEFSIHEFGQQAYIVLELAMDGLWMDRIKRW